MLKEAARCLFAFVATPDTAFKICKSKQMWKKHFQRAVTNTVCTAMMMVMIALLSSMIIVSNTTQVVNILNLLDLSDKTKKHGKQTKTDKADTYLSARFLFTSKQTVVYMEEELHIGFLIKIIHISLSSVSKCSQLFNSVYMHT
ncbi:hypothetical protein T4D_9156 [Trichinella pseudospiralis]|uniref:Uncharacterized protein n=1 Tax=Trichinella pseudospiralis TaxID=6337 RepID=A0A0V1FQZ2_TRIPS|nr:hypothetical protein T4D_9156 [Trichinella pseudospiralis]